MKVKFAAAALAIMNATSVFAQAQEVKKFPFDEDVNCAALLATSPVVTGTTQNGEASAYYALKTLQKYPSDAAERITERANKYKESHSFAKQQLSEGNVSHYNNYMQIYTASSANCINRMPK